MPRARTRPIASIVRGERSASSPISVRSRSHATASTARGKSAGSLSRTCSRRRTRRRRRSAAPTAGLRTRGIAPAPFVTRSTTSSMSGCASSRFGPIEPLVPAASSVWQLPQPLAAKISSPAAASPSSVEVGSSSVVSSGNVPMTVSGDGVTSSSPPQAARPTSSSARRAIRAIRLILAESNQRSNGRRHSPARDAGWPFERRQQAPRARARRPRPRPRRSHPTGCR